MSVTLDRARKMRGVIRGTTTKLFKKIEEGLNQTNINSETLEEFLNQLTVKENLLEESDKQIVDLVSTEELEKEIETNLEWSENIIQWKTRINQKLRKVSEKSNSTSAEPKQDRTDQPSINLPKLNLEKFSGDIGKFQSFWSHFEIAVHKNQQLAKPEKFAYLKSYLEGSAANSINGLQLSDKNYDSAIDILKQRFGRKDLMINAHMQKLLKLNQIKRASDVNSLRQLHDTCENEVRSLEALGVKTETYGNLLCPVLMQLLPEELTLEFSRKKDSDKEWDVEELLEFFRHELESRERAAMVSRTAPSKEYEREEKLRRGNYHLTQKREIRNTVPTASALNTVTTKPTCLYCNGTDHYFDYCQKLTIPEKREILKSKALCFVCLGYKHMARFCKSRNRCSYCGRKHHRSLCPDHNDHAQKEKPAAEALVNSANPVELARKPGLAVVLQTVKAIATGPGEEQVVRCLLDGGSQRTFICENTSRRLKLPVIAEEELKIHTFGNKNPATVKRRRVKLTLRNIMNPSLFIELEALETPVITSAIVQMPDENINNLLLANNIQLSESHTELEGNQELNILIGSDFYWRVVSGEMKRIDNALVALNSIFGWTLQGPTPASSYNVTTAEVLMNKVMTEDTLISNTLRKFWEIESIGIREETESTTDREAMDKFNEQVKFENNRYEVGLIWKTDKPELSDNYQIAENRLNQLKRKFRSDPIFFSRYNEVIQEQIREGMLEEIPPDKDCSEVKSKIIYYLPHHAVVKEERETTKLRVVYDASSHAKGSASLNECLLAGPNLLPELLSILIRFRMHKVALVGDITKAFLQISLREEDRDAVRMLWFKNSPLTNHEPKLLKLRHTRVLFGATTSPFLLSATIKHHLDKYKDSEPAACKQLNEDLYMDDFITGANTPSQAIELKQKATEIMAAAGMDLNKWRSNCKEVVETTTTTSELTKQSNSFKILGLSWKTEKDELFFDLQSLLSFVTEKENTKRFILQTSARIFDPLGLLCPFTIRIKILFQELWVRGVDWDDDIPEDMQITWKKWCLELPSVQDISIPRCYFHVHGGQSSQIQQLHVFSDASEKAYGAVAYLRYSSNGQEYNTRLICSKSRVAPLKRQSVPRLELMGALIAARLVKFVLQSLPQNFEVFMWTDSEIVLHWIKGRPTRWKQFVSNRVKDIQNLTEPAWWRHCNGSCNPADILTRGENAQQLKHCILWWQGPTWLEKDENYWPHQTNIFLNFNVLQEAVTESEDLKKPDVLNIPKYEPILELTNYETLNRILRVTAWVMRFVKNCKERKRSDTESLAADEIERAREYWIKVTQIKHFFEEINSIKSEGEVKTTSKIRDLHPYLNQHEILCVRGRLQKSNFTFQEREPIILPSNDRFTELVINYCHNKLLHAGLRDTMIEIRENFWILKGRKTVQRLLDKCLICKRTKVKPYTEIMAPLPKERVTQAPPFENVGIDFFGPLYIKDNSSSGKCYALILTCAVTRAIHLELLPDMSTTNFFLAFQKFIGRRGICQTVFSDNAKTFKLADKELQQLWKDLDSRQLLDYFSQRGIRWVFICERAPWWGGFWERMIRTVKSTLKKCLGRTSLRYLELETLLVEVEAVVNSRPLTVDYNSINELKVLTPAHFLIGRRMTALPCFNESRPELHLTQTRKEFLKRYKYRETLMNQFWRRWYKEYLLQLRSAYKFSTLTSATKIKVNDIVLVVDDKLPKQMWKIGRILETQIGRDGKIRSCLIKLGSGKIIRRPVQLISPLEVQDLSNEPSTNGGEC